jgi:hypothetical protein
MKTVAASRNISIRSVIHQSSGQISSDLAGEVVILNLQSGIYYGLDAVGARIWSLIHEPIEVNEVLSILLDEYEVEPEQCESDLLSVIAQLNAKELIEIRHETNL